MFSREVRLSIFGLVAFTFLVSPVMALTDYFEDFEDDTPGGFPTGSFYSSTSGVVTTDNALGTKAWGLQSTGSLNGNTGVELCNAVAGGETTTSVDFAIRFGGMPGSSASTFAAISMTGTGDNYILRFYGDGSMQLLLGAAAVNLPGTFTSGTWYNVTFAGFDCGEDKFCVGISELVTSACIDDAGGSTSLKNFVVSDFFSPSIANIRIDDLSYSDWQDQPPVSVSALVTVAVTDLVGFDVDPTGSGLIARVDGGDDIKSFTPNTLTEIGTREVDCNGVGNQNNDMVASSDFANLYVVCDGGSNNPAFFSIRSYNEEPPTFPSACGTDCLDDIDLRGGSECASGDDDFPDDLDLREINDVQSVPLDYSKTFGGTRVFAFAVAYSADNGNVGVLQYSARPSLDDRCRTVSRAFAGSTPEQISVWRPDATSENVYIAAVDSGGANRFYVYTPASTGSPARFEGTMTNGAPLGDTTGGVAVSCDDDYCLVVTTGATDNVRLINVKTGVTSWRTTSAGEVLRGAALAIRGDLGDGNDFAVWLDGATVKLAYANNGTVFGNLAIPGGGVFKEIRLKDGSSNAWIATSNIIAYYDLISAFPEIIPTGCENPPCDEDAGEDGATVLFPVTGLVDSGVFPTAGLANMFMGVLMMAGMTVTIGFSPQALTGGRAEFSARLFLVLGVIGAILGFVLAIAFGLFSTAVWVSMVVLAAIAIGVKVWLSRANGG